MSQKPAVDEKKIMVKAKVWVHARASAWVEVVAPASLKDLPKEELEFRLQDEIEKSQSEPEIEDLLEYKVEELDAYVLPWKTEAERKRLTKKFGEDSVYDWPVEE